MASTYVNDLRLNEMATGDGSGTWGTTTNTNLELIGESMGYGTEAVANASTHTITMADGATDGFRCTFLRLTGGGQACTVTLAPNTLSHTWIVRNATSYALTFTQGSGANVIIAAGLAKMVTTDGLGSGAVVYECLEDLELGGTLTVGIDDTGQDVKFFGATSGAYMLWDESADDLKLVGAAGFTVAGDIDVDGTANLDVVDIDGAVDMASTLAVAGVLTGASLDISGDIDIDGTSNLDAVDVDGAVNFAADVTYADGADIITASAGTSNFRAGVNAGNSIASGGNYNVCVGDEAGTAITTGDSNTVIGSSSSIALTVGDNNTAVGQGSFYTATDSDNNTAVGHSSMFSTTTGDANTAVGRESLRANTTAGNNTAVGHQSLYANTTGQNNVAVGISTLVANTTASDNTVVGGHAGAANTTGTKNVALGQSALYTNTTGDNNTALGKDALLANTTAGNNTAVGYASLTANTTGTSSVAVGVNALLVNTTGADNTALGKDSLKANTTASNNTAVGKDALAANTTGTSNVAMGYLAMDASTSADQNTAVGKSAMGACTTGGFNVGLGDSAMHALTTGGNNVGVGVSSGGSTVNLTTGSQNAFLGNYCHTSAADSISQTVLGYNVVGSANNTLTVGNAGSDSTLAYGGTTWSAPSDLRYKKNIADSTAGLSFINDLRPITFEWKNEGDLPEGHRARVEGSTTPYNNPNTNHGFVAQEVKEAIDNHSEIKDGFRMWSEDEADDRQRVGDGYLVPMLVKAIQELSEQVEELKSQPVCKCKGE